MTIKLTVREAVAAYQAIEGLPNLPNRKISYHLGRIGDFCEQETRRFEKEKQKLQREMVGEPDKDGNRKLLPDKQYEFIDALEELLDNEAVEIAKDTVTVEDVLGTDVAKQPEIAPATWRALAKIIVEAKG
jgi:hypothetical protein